MLRRKFGKPWIGLYRPGTPPYHEASPGWCVLNVIAYQYLVHWPQAIEYRRKSYRLISLTQVDFVSFDPAKNPLPRHPDGSLVMNEKVTFNDSWAEVEKLLQTGKVRAIGVSNFSVKK